MEQLADGVFEDEGLLSILKERVKQALLQRGSRIDPQKFVRASHKQASIVCPALLSRARLEPSEIAAELDLLTRDRPNRFNGRASWIHNNFVGCYLQLYRPYSRVCPFYAGFSTFVHLSRGNLRHFLELCYKSMTRASEELSLTAPRVDAKKQAEAARQASTGFLGEIRSFGRRGEQLYVFALRLGAMFALAHSRPTQSEPEQNHFAIVGGSAQLNADDLLLLTEAQKWSVLFEEQATKQKDLARPDSVEYVLNPIYAPYFYLSYRKRRKLDLTSDQVICLLRGTLEQFANLMKDIARRWEVGGVDTSPVAPDLFSGN
jgi:hypothetical protein